MSKYTTQVRLICESKAGLTESKGFDDVEQILTLSAPLIFKDFPIFDPAYKLPLEKKILKHYYMREIGEETVGLWELRLDTVMNEIMPYYNQLYDSELLSIGYSPFNDIDLSRNHILVKDGKDTSVVNNEFDNKSDGNSGSTAWDKVSDTPQGSVQNIDNDTYLSRARKNTDNSETHTTANGTHYVVRRLQHRANGFTRLRRKGGIAKKKYVDATQHLFFSNFTRQ